METARKKAINYLQLLHLIILFHFRDMLSWDKVTTIFVFLPFLISRFLCFSTSIWSSSSTTYKSSLQSSVKYSGRYHRKKSDDRSRSMPHTISSNEKKWNARVKKNMLVNFNSSWNFAVKWSTYNYLDIQDTSKCDML